MVPTEVASPKPTQLRWRVAVEIRSFCAVNRRLTVSNVLDTLQVGFEGLAWCAKSRAGPSFEEKSSTSIRITPFGDERMRATSSFVTRQWYNFKLPTPQTLFAGIKGRPMYLVVLAYCNRKDTSTCATVKGCQKPSVSHMLALHFTREFARHKINVHFIV